MDHGPGQHAWAQTEVVLDTIFDFLDPSDLKSARLTCRKWAVEGCRHLTRKTFIRLSQVTTAAADSNGHLLLPHFMDHFLHRKYGHQHDFRQSLANSFGKLDKDGYSVDYEKDIWESTGDLEPRDYLTIGAYHSYIKSDVFSSGFKPRSVIVYIYNDLVELPMPHFSNLEKLHIVFVTANQVYDLLRKAVVLLPNLKTLKLGNIVPKRDFHAKNKKPGLAICDTEQHSCLEELSLYVPADLLYLDWSFLAKFSKLKKLQILWPGSLCSDGSNFNPSPAWNMTKSYRNSKNFGNWLQTMNPCINWSSLTTLSLRFDLMSTNIQNVQSTLAAAVNLESLSLQVYGPLSKLRKFIKGLGPKNVALLQDFQHSSEDMLLDDNAAAGIRILKMLKDRSFFLKPTWTVTFRGFNGGCCCMEKTLTNFTFQTPTHTRFLDDFIFIQTLWRELPAVFANYNFAVIIDTDLYKVTRTWSEAVGSDAFLDDDFLSCKLLPRTERAAKGIRQKPFDRLLCDLVGFYKEVGSCMGKHSRDINIRTFTFTHVSLLSMERLLCQRPPDAARPSIKRLAGHGRESGQPSAKQQRTVVEHDA